MGRLIMRSFTLETQFITLVLAWTPGWVIGSI
jgi:hypothetical protein